LPQNEKKANRSSTTIFLIGLAIFAVGILAYLFGFPVPSPAVPPLVVNGVPLYALFLNWPVIIGIFVMAVGFAAYYLTGKRKN
jgi:uncharacterized BrkB/YihY/UPF0761 family membrane protein